MCGLAKNMHLLLYGNSCLLNGCSWLKLHFFQVFFLLSKKKTAVRLKVETRHIQGSGTLIRFRVFFSLRSACLYFSLSFSRSCCLLIDYIIISGCFTVLTRGEGGKGTMSLSIERYFCRWLWTSSIILFDDRDAVGVANAPMLMITRARLPQTVALDGWVCDVAHTSFAFSKQQPTAIVYFPPAWHTLTTTTSQPIKACCLSGKLTALLVDLPTTRGTSGGGYGSESMRANDLPFYTTC